MNQPVESVYQSTVNKLLNQLTVLLFNQSDHVSYKGQVVVWLSRPPVNLSVMNGQRTKKLSNVCHDIINSLAMGN